VLPWVISTDTLEYDLTSRIRSMVSDTERRIGVIVGDNFRQWREDFGYLGRTLSDAGYLVRVISPGDEIPDNLPAIFVLGGVENLDSWALYRIDRYIQQGGRVLFAVKGVFIDTPGGTVEARQQEDHGLLQMLASYGVIVRPELVLDRTALTLQYQNRMPSGAIQYRIIRYPFWIGITQDNGNLEHPVSAGFSGLDLYWSSPLELVPLPQVEAIPLFYSSHEAWLMRGDFYTNPEMTYYINKDAADTRGTKILGASLSGEMPSFFQGSPKPVREGSDEQLPDMPSQTALSRIIVVGDVDFATNMISASNASKNLDFLLRAADWLVSDDDIITIRNRQANAGRLDKITEPEKRASAMRFIQIVNVGLVPLLVIASGLFIAYRRRVRSRNAALGFAEKTAKEN
jgi:ABC-type uncharacterized transport system involved in gliding motility auxiliary subunit